MRGSVQLSLAAMYLFSEIPNSVRFFAFLFLLIFAVVHPFPDLIIWFSTTLVSSSYCLGFLQLLALLSFYFQSYFYCLDHTFSFDCSGLMVCSHFAIVPVKW